jgi:hypothetical protein
VCVAAVREVVGNGQQRKAKKEAKVNQATKQNNPKRA